MARTSSFTSGGRDSMRGLLWWSQARRLFRIVEELCWVVGRRVPAEAPVVCMMPRINLIGNTFYLRQFPPRHDFILVL